MSGRRPRANEGIRVPKVLLVLDDGTTEEMTPEEALERARSEELDLIEVSPKAQPPVVKIGDLGRYMYQQKKKDQKQKAHSKQTEVKMLRFGFRTERHDLERIMDRAREFIAERHLVRLVVRLRGREMTNKDYAKKKILTLVQDLSDVTEVEQEIRSQGNQFNVVLRPKRQ
ncbi:MAG: translation initiation factor IF-3 [Candidatus Peribacteraceae bacterium]|nr:translation initiation factor IF-3 [Candidatus Peribacteraceae bacterium]